MSGMIAAQTLENQALGAPTLKSFVINDGARLVKKTKDCIALGAAGPRSFPSVVVDGLVLVGGMPWRRSGWLLSP